MNFNPAEWSIASPSQLMEVFGSPEGHGLAALRGGCRLSFRKYLTTYEVYAYLKARFGKPNGFQTFLKQPNDSDNLIQWDYLIYSDHTPIWIVGKNREIEFVVGGRKLSAKDWVRLRASLRGDFERVSRDLKATTSTFQKWNVIPNKFGLIADTCAEHYDVVTALSKTPTFEPPRRTTEAGIRKYYGQLRRLGRRASDLASSCLILDMLTPVLAESFINTLILLFRKAELKNNPRQYESFLRQQIDHRVFDLHLKCNFFRRGVDPDSEDFKRFKAIMDRRNSLLHGSVDPIKDRIQTVYFDDFIPLYRDGGDNMLEFFRGQEHNYDTRGVISRYIDVHMFLIYVQGLLEDKARVSLGWHLERNQFGWDVIRQVPGILFPPWNVAMIMPALYDDELKVDWK